MGFVPKNFILFWVIANNTVFNCGFQVFLLLHRYTEIQLILVFLSYHWWTHLLVMGILYNFPLSCHLQIEAVSFLLSNLYAYISCFYFIVMTFSTRLNKNGESEHPCLVPILKGKAFGVSFSEWRKVYSRFFFCKWTSSCTSTVYWKDYPFSIGLPLLLC